MKDISGRLTGSCPENVRSRVHFRRPTKNKWLPLSPSPCPVSESDSQALGMSSSACPSALAANRPPPLHFLQAGYVASATGLEPDHVVSRADRRMRVGGSDARRRSRHRTERLRADRIPLQDKETTDERLQGDSETAPGKPDTPRSASPRLRWDVGRRAPRGLFLDECGYSHRVDRYASIANSRSRASLTRPLGVAAECPV